MASIQEMKDALSVDQKHAIDATETAMAAIDMLLSMSQWVLAILAVILALVAVFGFWEVRRFAAAKAEEIAKEHAKNYLESSVFVEKLEERIKHALDVQKENEAAKGLNVEDDGEPSEFEAPPQGTHRNDTI